MPLTLQDVSKDDGNDLVKNVSNLFLMICEPKLQKPVPSQDLNQDLFGR